MRKKSTGTVGQRAWRAWVGGVKTPRWWAAASWVGMATCLAGCIVPVGGKLPDAEGKVPSIPQRLNEAGVPWRGDGQTFGDPIAIYVVPGMGGKVDELSGGYELATDLADALRDRGADVAWVWPSQWPRHTQQLKRDAFARDEQLDDFRVGLTATIRHEMLRDRLADVAVQTGRAPGRQAILDEVQTELLALSAPQTQDGPRTTVIAITESLGSKILFDALNEMPDDQRAQVHIPVVYCLANQLAFLGLTDPPQPDRDPTDPPPLDYAVHDAQQKPRLPGEGPRTHRDADDRFFTPLPRPGTMPGDAAALESGDRAPASSADDPLTELLRGAFPPSARPEAALTDEPKPEPATLLVDLYDPNDLLSFPLPPAAVHAAGLAYAAQPVRTARVGLWIPCFGTLAHPVDAHSPGLADSQRVFRLMMDGAN